MARRSSPTVADVERIAALADPVPVLVLAREFEILRITDDPAAVPYQIFLAHDRQAMAPAYGLLHHRVGGVLVGLDAVERVEDEKKLHDDFLVCFSVAVCH